MTVIGRNPVEMMMREEAARQKAREDWAYADEMRKLQEQAKTSPTAGDPNEWKPQTT